ncbi:DNA helicase [Virgibacillus pantothenticus]|uniref:3'-5' exonuclease n=1 Tax=Virgibacillus pantothenticus TaxID=1473 RepID=UPI001B134E4E|nr:3'-5' exonuclease [Virgibacillus pantothenticus]MBU8568820.1 NERD domain-containing protein [Virgibacillus pantothenticus]MBU8602866.1 NERD domain-containing protein [Virgibacillus pantothenticus]MBU8636973.1 NERD domain-containing protein [Virgibacillus pantothenticus]MBU8644748.1 NERD domain-containing protein [Virgibacillus pantothenticus]MBU8648902.1 NERD domain-containing protein [Virgibacillus pantothenticus]
MAITVPESIRSSATVGERILFHTLKECLDDDYIVYYEPEINGKRPDFLIIGPYLGLLVLEVKDYTINTLHRLTKNEWIINSKSDGMVTVDSPLKQAKDYMFSVQNLLKKDKNLTHQEGKYLGKLKFPCGYGAVLTRLNQKQCIKTDLYEVAEPTLLLTRDEIDPDHDNFSEELLIEKLMNMFTIPFRLREPLSSEEMNAIRYHLFPEVRISREFKQASPYRDQLLLSLHNLETMDLHQEKLAKQLGDKNRLIRGVAGSGKTLILASRARLIKREHPDWNILILCYNISLSRSIETMVRAKMDEPTDLFEAAAISEKNDCMKGITVKNFHEWLKKDLDITEEQLPTVIEKLENNETILPKYDAVLIDEGQDFKSEWLRLVSLLLNEETYSMLLVEDRAQTINHRGRNYLQNAGLDFRGRSKILQINYRNTSQIINFAWDFYQAHAVSKKVITGTVEGQEIIPPLSTRRKGPDPVLARAASLHEEAQMVARAMKKLHQEKKVPYEEMLVLYRVRRTYKINVINILKSTFKQHQIPYKWVTENQETKRNYKKDDGSAKIFTLDSSKGLDFQAVFIVNADNTPFALEEDNDREAALMYIGMTRAIEYLMISYSGKTEYTDYFDHILKKRQLEEDREVANK